MATSDGHTTKGSSQEPATSATTQSFIIENNGSRIVDASINIQPKSQASMTCAICEENPSKYKCPRCYLPYCSVACNKIHRQNHIADPDPAPKLPVTQPQPPPINLLDHEEKHAGPFQILEQSEQLQYLFKKYPRLRTQLLDIHAATLEPASAKSRIPASLLKDLPGNGSDWNPEKGIESGKQALRKARNVKGEDGEAIREYSELVLHLMDKSSSRIDG